MVSLRLCRSFAAGALALVFWLPGCAREPVPPATLVLISVDTLRADHLAAYGSTRGLTPNLDALAAESQLFEAAYAPAPFTRPSVAALLTGREPARIGMLSNRSLLAEAVPTLAVVFAAAGFATGAVVSNPVLKRGTGLARGFALYDDTTPAREAAGGLQDREATATTDAAIAALDNLRRDGAKGLFLWVHYQDPHGPYRPPPGERERFLAGERERPDAARRLPVSPGESGQGALPAYQVVRDVRSPAFYRAGYAAEVAHVDREIGRLFAALRDRALYDDAVVVFVADHGEGLGENDYWFAHGENLSEALVRIPLFIRTSARPHATRSDAASLVDLAGTLAAEFGLALPAEHDGRNLLASDSAAGNAPVFLSTLAYVTPPRFGAANARFRYVIDKQGAATRERLFALGAEGEDVAAAHPEVVAELGAFTRERVREMRSADGERRGEIDEAERRALRALGYSED